MKKVFKKVLVLSLSVFLLTSVFCSCGKKGEKIAILIPEGNTDFLTGLNYFAEKYSKNYSREIIVFKAKDQKEQSKQISGLSRSEYAAAVLYPVGSQKSESEKLKKKGIKLMFFMQKASEDYNSFYSIDVPSVGSCAAQYIYAKRQNVKTSNVAVITTSSKENRELVNAFSEEAIKYPVISLKNTYTIDKIIKTDVAWALRTALKENKDINTVYCPDDKIAAICADIVKEKYKDIDMIIGSGAKQCFLSKIEDSDILLATSFFSPLMIRDCIINAINLASGSPVNKDTSITSYIIDSSNVRQYIDIESVY